MTTQQVIKQTTAWQAGTNEPADNSLNMSRDALIQGNLLRCFTLVCDAMTQYGWEYHPDRKARRLWGASKNLCSRIKDSGSINNPKIKAAIEDIYYATYRAVHLDRDRKVRRNMPPDDPAVRVESLITVCIPQSS